MPLSHESKFRDLKFRRYFEFTDMLIQRSKIKLQEGIQKITS